MNRKKKLHVIGMCGKGTSATALLMREHGWEISGSDQSIFEPIAGYLKKHGVPCFETYHADNLPDDTDMVLLGSTAMIDTRSNPELLKAQELDIPIKSFAEILSDLTQDSDNIVVSGSYGKSTCSALLAHYLESQGKSPSYFIGAVPLGMHQSSKMGSSKYFVLEGDEYPHSTHDMTSKFMFYHAGSVLLTSGEHDHINKFPTKESYIQPYKELVATLPSKGILVSAINHPNVAEISQSSSAPVVTYGLKNADYTAKNISFAENTHFDIYHKEEFLGTFETSLLGLHNIENIIGTVALSLEKKILSVSELQDAVASFKGIKRRLDLKSQATSIPIYEGYGTSYTKVKTAIQAIKLHFPEKQLITIFEPHTFSWRNKNNLYWYHDAFVGSCEVMIYRPPTHGAQSHEQITQSQILETLKDHNQNAVAIHSEKEVFDIFEKKLNKDSIILILSSADLEGMIISIPKYCEQKFPK